MNHEYDIKELLEKFYRNECSEEELGQVITYFKKQELTADFPNVEETEAMLSSDDLDDATADRIFRNIVGEETPVIPLYRKKHYPFVRYASVAAIFLVVLSSAWFLYRQTDTANNVGTSAAKPEMPNAITLKTADGKIHILKSGQNVAVLDSNGKLIANQEDGKLVYDSSDESESAYNTLTIPYGQRFSLQLSDGTLVYLNAGTTLKYPVNFKGAQRLVYLEGEAYFEVAKDKKHPFIVNTDDMNIGVLGTHFNVSNYPEDEHTEAVLAEGSICMFTKDQSFDPKTNLLLKPGEKGSYDRATKKIQTSPVATETYISWVRGELYFHNLTFAQICRKMERKYNVVIENRDAQLASERFNASFSDVPVLKVLGYFNEIRPIEYRISGNKLIIQKKKNP
ncbi:FecR family protein [Flavobacterium silvaticum]|uniref:FecR family protein n=1 Tax=Flavobacterium silvaticum TaxID=1852020 RepID=A0A972JIU0_9FLAO|nr:FecR family protein [Flavobacterium silvaticum]NMH27537.1 FecR family protein [Flavobacterium silvaticum]